MIQTRGAPPKNITDPNPIPSQRPDLLAGVQTDMIEKVAEDPSTTQEQQTLGSAPPSEIVSVVEEYDPEEYDPEESEVPDIEGIQTGSTFVVVGAEAARQEESIEEKGDD